MPDGSRSSVPSAAPRLVSGRRAFATDFQKQCPGCMRLITFDSASGDENVFRAMRAANRLRLALLDQKQAAAISSDRFQ